MSAMSERHHGRVGSCGGNLCENYVMIRYGQASVARVPENWMWIISDRSNGGQCCGHASFDVEAAIDG